MSPSQVIVLSRCAQQGAVDGLSSNFAYQAGMTRQVNWLLKRGLIKLVHGRYVSTVMGVTALRLKHAR